MNTRTQTPIVVISHDMPPELFIDVSATLRSMGVVVRAEGPTPSSSGTKVIVVVSPKGGSGKSTVALVIASTLAARGAFFRAVKEGEWTAWHAKGGLATRGVYLAGQPTGRWQSWTDDGHEASVMTHNLRQ